MNGKQVGKDIHVSDRQTILTRLLDAVKQCQVRFGGKTELATESDSRVCCLCSSWETALSHGLRHSNKALSTLKQVTEMAGLTKMSGIAILDDIKNMETEPVYWHYVREFLSKHEMQRYSLLKMVTTDAGRGRAWLRAAFNEHSLEKYMHMLLEDDLLLKQYYEDWSFLRDQERSSMMPMMSAGLGSILFAINIDNPDLNTIKPATGLDAILSSTPPTKLPYSRMDDEPKPVIAGDNSPHVERKRSRKKRKKPAHLVSFDDDDLSSYSASPASSVTSPLLPSAGVDLNSLPTIISSNPATIRTEGFTPHRDQPNAAKRAPLVKQESQEGKKGARERGTLGARRESTESTGSKTSLVDQSSPSHQRNVHIAQQVTGVPVSPSEQNSDAEPSAMSEQKEQNASSPTIDCKAISVLTVKEIAEGENSEGRLAITDGPQKNSDLNENADVDLSADQCDEVQDGCNGGETVGVEKEDSNNTNDASCNDLMVEKHESSNSVPQLSALITSDNVPNQNSDQQVTYYDQDMKISNEPPGGGAKNISGERNADKQFQEISEIPDQVESAGNDGAIMDRQLECGLQTENSFPRSLDLRQEYVSYDQREIKQSQNTDQPESDTQVDWYLPSQNENVLPSNSQTISQKSYLMGRYAPAKDTVPDKPTLDLDNRNDTTKWSSSSLDAKGSIGSVEGRMRRVDSMDSGSDIKLYQGDDSSSRYSPSSIDSGNIYSGTVDNSSTLTPLSPEGQPIGDNIIPLSSSAAAVASSYDSSEVLASYNDITESAAFALAIAQRGFATSQGMRTQGDGSYTPDPIPDRQDTLTNSELKQAVVDMMRRKDEVEDHNRSLVGMLETEKERVTTMQLEIEELTRNSQQRHERDAEKIKSLTKENELLKHQLKKYVSAVQMLRSEGAGSNADLGIKLDDLQPSIPPAKVAIDYSFEASEYEKKLIQVAEMHGELMEFNDVLHRTLNAKEAQVKRLRQELTDLRGPLPEDFQGSDDSGSISSDFDGSSLSTRPLINIWMPSAFLRGTSSDAYHVYQIFIRVGNEEWNVYRRYAEFYELHIKLKKRHPVATTFEFPPKKAIGNKDPKFVEDRRKKLQRYLRQVINLLLQRQDFNTATINKQYLFTTLPFFVDAPQTAEKKGKSRKKSRGGGRVSVASPSSPTLDSPQYMGL